MHGKPAVTVHQVKLVALHPVPGAIYIVIAFAIAGHQQSQSCSLLLAMPGLFQFLIKKKMVRI